ncbi:DUF1656 domain-containing protein [Pseudomonas aeruginosa]|uniref:DUF1656 domain-containing protein n=1 Tax=Pseudomonas aeruginosa TaxID=287 RepID=UPI000C1FD288|nr:DUF1656 domain-containing protein [Pseudomonas aeruginosa]PJF49122.1 DUF1656 domain-containing protein [Pseudomonas aeruginosa]
MSIVRLSKVAAAFACGRLALCLAMPLYLLLERLAWRWLECAWHPGLLRFLLSFIVLSVLVLKF